MSLPLHDIPPVDRYRHLMGEVLHGLNHALTFTRAAAGGGWAMSSKPLMQAVETINGTGPAPAARPRRGRRGPYSAVYDRAETLKPGQWFRVAESALWDERRRVLAHEAIRKGFANRDMLDLIDCYIYHAGNIVVAARNGGGA